MPVIRFNKQRPNTVKKSFSIKEFYEKRNKILINRNVGGLGDILMHRMIFEDFKRMMPDVEIHFAIPSYYHPVVQDHPYIDKIISLENLDRSDYIIVYNTTTICGRTEMKNAPFHSPHRSDIWANQCGVVLTNHDMHFRISEKEQQIGREILEKNRDRVGKTIVISPVSAMTNKNLPERMLEIIVKELQKNYYVVGLHNSPINLFIKKNFPCIHGINLREWLGVIHQTDYVLSVDTAVFHAAGGLKKPTVGVFTFTSGEVYGKYYPTTKIVQGPCPVNYNGCYNWGNCPEGKVLPCLKNLNANTILEAVNNICLN